MHEIQSESERYYNDRSSYHNRTAELHPRVFDKIGEREMLAALTSHLDKQAFLYGFHQQQFPLILDHQFRHDEDRIEAKIAILGLLIENFNFIDLTPSFRLESGEPRTYRAHDIKAWSTIDVSKVDKCFDDYIGDIQSHGFCDEKYSRRYELLKVLEGEFLAYIKKIVKPLTKPTPIEIFTRNADAKRLVEECVLYPLNLKSHLLKVVKSFRDSFKGKDKFSELFLSNLYDVLYGEELNLNEFHKSIVNLQWSQLEELVEDGEAQTLVVLIRGEVDSYIKTFEKRWAETVQRNNT